MLCQVTGRLVSGNWKRPLPDLCTVLVVDGRNWQKVMEGLRTVHLVGVEVWLYGEVRIIGYSKQ
jgi:hypothetical protein